ncbi:hypothetical protein QO179_10080 [Bacillus stercoris]|nr:hypothetical protein [Bacillus stercoris]
MTHANILRTVKKTNYLSITEQDTILGLSNYVFDAFMFDMFGSLLNGAKLVLIPKKPSWIWLACLASLNGRTSAFS